MWAVLSLAPLFRPCAFELALATSANFRITSVCASQTVARGLSSSVPDRTKLPFVKQLFYGHVAHELVSMAILLTICGLVFVHVSFTLGPILGRVDGHV
jgi:hypothetical protein